MSTVGVSWAMSGNLGRWSDGKRRMLAIPRRPAGECGEGPRVRQTGVGSLRPVREGRMRLVHRFAATIVLTVTLTAAREARPDGHEDGAATDDLLSCFRPFYGRGNKWNTESADVPWTDWWFANRREVSPANPRAMTTTQGAPLPEDVKARERAREALLAALASKDPLTSSEAALALGRAGDARDIAPLAAVVNDRDVSSTRRKHRYAAIGLGMLPMGDAAQA